MDFTFCKKNIHSNNNPARKSAIAKLQMQKNVPLCSFLFRIITMTISKLEKPMKTPTVVAAISIALDPALSW